MRWVPGERFVPGLTVKNIHKSYDTVDVLKDVSLDIQDGEFLTLLGPSGCGKTTLLRIIAGLEQHDSGTVEIDGKTVDRLRPSQRDLAMVFQSYALYPHLTVAQNMATPLVLRDLSFWERFPILGRFVPGRRAKVNALLGVVRETAETLKIEHLLDRKPGQLSGGQRQRAALGRAMVRKPVAFLMDEPLSNLDAGLRVHMRAELAELHRSLATTFIYVTHDQTEALTMSDRMAVMMGGDILQIGAPNDVYQDPKDLRVAEFVGSPKINVIPAESDSAGRISCLGISLERVLEKPAATALSIGIRAEHLSLQPKTASGGFPGSLVHTENLGSDVFLHISVNDGSQRIIVRAKPLEAMDVTIGDDLWVGMQHDKVLAFGDDGKRRALSNTHVTEQVA